MNTICAFCLIPVAVTLASFDRSNSFSCDNGFGVAVIGDEVHLSGVITTPSIGHKYSFSVNGENDFSLLVYNPQMIALMALEDIPININSQ